MISNKKAIEIINMIKKIFILNKINPIYRYNFIYLNRDHITLISKLICPETIYIQLVIVMIKN